MITQLRVPTASTFRIVAVSEVPFFALVRIVFTFSGVASGLVPAHNQSGRRRVRPSDEPQSLC